MLSPKGRQAKPSRGPICFVSFFVMFSGTPAWLLV